MMCPFCKKDTKVLESRQSDNSLRRRRECLKCSRRFTTYERVESTNVLVVKRSGERQQFNKDKIRYGILRACEKRAIPGDKIERVIDVVEEKVKKSKKGEITTEQIGKTVLQELKKLDKVAYIRFASVYSDFADPEDFHEVLDEITKRGKK